MRPRHSESHLAILHGIRISCGVYVCVRPVAVLRSIGHSGQPYWFMTTVRPLTPTACNYSHVLIISSISHKHSHLKVYTCKWLLSIAVVIVCVQCLTMYPSIRIIISACVRREGIKVIISYYICGTYTGG